MWSVRGTHQWTPAPGEFPCHVRTTLPIFAKHASLATVYHPCNPAKATEKPTVMVPYYNGGSQCGAAVSRTVMSASYERGWTQPQWNQRVTHWGVSTANRAWGARLIVQRTQFKVAQHELPEHRDEGKKGKESGVGGEGFQLSGGGPRIWGALYHILVRVRGRTRLCGTEGKMWGYPVPFGQAPAERSVDFTIHAS